ncbi:efflux RND transporter periplasmic adaptor subunit [Ramlibacter humi]|uniref:Efflux RND transporter periplasmic adaptor subunit n=1 Tax=Ramlibacter humi TaxID=2530451 RepID=A0A4Z0BGF1_9BURK|nr:efflux RND transporter periplasmic adaptor subunit [Ramlibacter humi]TFY97214.1 efflux RND transporter periplasmic adaptor subunit [Ramlibacter humi]
MSHESHSQLAIHPVEDSADAPGRQQVMRRTRIAAIVVLVLLAAGGARTVVSRAANAKTLEAESARSSTTYVRATRVRSGGSAQKLELPGTLQGFVQAPVAARAGGYLKRWTKDIGSTVAKGDLLAEIETPELDQQLSQAMAARQQTAASVDLAKTTVDRWEALRQRDAVSQQELEERRSGYLQAKANLAAADANVERLRELQSFKRVVAPFAGVITRRNVDVGDLIDGSGKPLFLLSQTDPLRVYVNVPQSYAHLVRQGLAATVTQAEVRGRSFSGQVARTAAAIDTATRTMQVEVSLPNKDGALMPGAFVQVALNLPAGQGIAIPFNALLFRADGVSVASIDGDGSVRLRPVKLGRNYGDSVEILNGLQGNEQLVLNPSDSLAEGDKVQVVQDTRPAAAAGKATP